MRFLLDMNFSPRVAEWLRVQGHDAVHVHEQGHGNWDDRAIFNTAIEDRRIVLSFDLDFGDIVAAADQNMCGFDDCLSDASDLVPRTSSDRTIHNFRVETSVASRLRS